jgi:dCMP deaminase
MMIGYELEEEWRLFYLRLATLVSTKSKDTSSKFGAVLVRPDKTVASIGFNGFPARIRDVNVYLKSTSYRNEKLLRIVHAEVNCIDHSRDLDTKGYHLFVNGHPCERCALKIASTGIDFVYYWEDPAYDYATRWAASILKAQTIFKEAKVQLIPVPYDLG